MRNALLASGLLVLLVLVFGGCAPKAEPESTEFYPDTILSETTARMLAARLANEALIDQKVATAVGPGDFEDVDRGRSRWDLQTDHENDKPWAKVSFRLDGTDPEVQAGFGDD